MIKNLYSGKLTIITPCFCTGADQNKPEIRAASIRGQLRWWFRVLGGTREQEVNVFGGTGQGEADSKAKASKVVVRVRDVKLISGDKINPNPNTIEQYLYYFAMVSGKEEGISRTTSGNYFDRGSSFRLEILLKSDLNSDEFNLLNDAIELFLRLGSIGLRATRACGCFTAEGKDAVDFDYSKFPNLLVGKYNQEAYKDGKAAQIVLGGWLKDTLRKENHISSNEKSPLGYTIKKDRESSALKLRPIEYNGKFLTYFYYTDEACGMDESLKHLFLKNKIN